MVNSGFAHGHRSDKKTPPVSVAWRDRRRSVSALASARCLRPDGVLPSFDRLAVAGPSAGGRRSFRHHVSNSAAHVAPHACGFLTATKAEGEPEGKRERADDPYEQDVDERCGDADLRRRCDDAEAKGRSVR